MRKEASHFRGYRLTGTLFGNALGYKVEKIDRSRDRRDKWRAWSHMQRGSIDFILAGEQPN